MDTTGRTLLTTGAAAVAAATAPRTFAQTPGKGESAQSFYQRGDVRIRYEEVGSGFPLLIIPGGGQNSTIAWAAKNAPFNAAEALKGDCDGIRDAGTEVRGRHVSVERYARQNTRGSAPGAHLFTGAPAGDGLKPRRTVGCAG